MLAIGVAESERVEPFELVRGSSDIGRDRDGISVNVCKTGIG